MLFNSVPFLFCYLPATLAGFFILARLSHGLAAMWVALASIFFYGWWNANFVGLLLSSIVFNYGAGYLIAREIRKTSRNFGRPFLVGAIVSNLSLLGYFKYANFFVDSAGTLLGTPLSLWQITLPLGISFFTFTQIAFLVDSYQGKVKDFDFIRYLLFVTYFPHLIAGPIIHHKQVMPQFAERKTYQINWSNVAIGVTFLIIGLVKKVLVADNLALIATPIFDLAAQGGQVKFATAWVGATAYTLQLYFDFSGYSDMAIGLSLIFNVKLPLNFNSPYKAVNVIDFWKRWHMTLSIFLRDYLYIPLGGNRRGKLRRYVNLFITMLLGGLWHGAGWTFVIWGSLHGLYLIANHAFHTIKEQLGWPRNRFGAAGTLAGGALTFACVVVGWAIFKSDGLATAWSMIRSMFGGCLFAECDSLNEFLFTSSIDPRVSVALCIAAGLVAIWTLPNTQEFVFGKSTLDAQNSRRLRWPMRLQWNPSAWWCWMPLGLLMALITISIASNPISQFLYFQF